MESYIKNKKIQENRWKIFVSIALFTLMSALDGSIVNIALPNIAKTLNVQMNQSEWIVSIYLMFICSLLLLFGKISDSKGKVNVFKIGTIVFILGSALCAISQNFFMLLFSRIIQAVGASMTMATNTGIITELFPINERGKALGMMGAFVSVGAIAGPGLGGLILSHLSWSYIFWINLPIGLITILFGWKVLPEDINKSNKKIDFKGFLFLFISITSLFCGLFIGQELGFSNLIVIFIFLVTIVSFWIFMRVERNALSPIVDIKIFKNKEFSKGLISATLIFSSNFFVNAVIPFYLQNILHLSTSLSGGLMTIFPFFMVATAPISGFFTDKIGPLKVLKSGLLLLFISQIMYALLGKETGLMYYAIATGIMGIGNALFQPANNTIIMSNVDVDNLGIAGSLNSFARNLGMVLGISLSTTILYSSTSIKYGSTIAKSLVMHPEEFVFGMRTTFIGSLILCFFAILLTYKKNRKM